MTKNIGEKLNHNGSLPGAATLLPRLTHFRIIIYTLSEMASQNVKPLPPTPSRNFFVCILHSTHASDIWPEHENYSTYPASSLPVCVLFFYFLVSVSQAHNLCDTTAFRCMRRVLGECKNSCLMYH